AGRECVRVECPVGVLLARVGHPDANRLCHQRRGQSPDGGHEQITLPPAELLVVPEVAAQLLRIGDVRVKEPDVRTHLRFHPGPGLPRRTPKLTCPAGAGSYEPQKACMPGGSGAAPHMLTYPGR